MQERDRKLIAYEIHDGLAQQLTGALLRFQAYSELSDPHGEEAQGTFDAAMALLGNGMDETRRLIDGLRPPILDESGVAAAIEYLVCEVRERCSLDIEYIVDVHFDRLAFPLEGALFRVVQESLTNACRHSKSKSIKVQLLHQGDRVIVEVQDWGVGPAKGPESTSNCRWSRGYRIVVSRLRLRKCATAS
jgi:signal transduction histidine kinase